MQKLCRIHSFNNGHFNKKKQIHWKSCSIIVWYFPEVQNVQDTIDIIQIVINKISYYTDNNDHLVQIYFSQYHKADLRKETNKNNDLGQEEQMEKMLFFWLIMSSWHNQKQGDSN